MPAHRFTGCRACCYSRIIHFLKTSAIPNPDHSVSLRFTALICCYPLVRIFNAGVQPGSLAMDLWHCGSVALWICRIVDLSHCGAKAHCFAVLPYVIIRLRQYRHPDLLPWSSPVLRTGQRRNQHSCRDTAKGRKWVAI